MLVKEKDRLCFELIIFLLDEIKDLRDVTHPLDDRSRFYEIEEKISDYRQAIEIQYSDDQGSGGVE